jgi:YfiH family protein
MQYLSRRAGLTVVRSGLLDEAGEFEWLMTTREAAWAQAVHPISAAAESDDLRRKVLDAVGLPSACLVRCGQVHGDVILEASPEFAAKYSELGVLLEPADGLVANGSGLVLCIRTADCPSVAVCCGATGAFGIVHSGWRSTAMNIVGKLVERLCTTFGATPATMKAVVSPAISMKNYEVGGEVVEAVAATVSESGSFSERAGDKFRIDLSAVIALQLTDKGVPASNIELPELCTFERSDLFFSWRRARESGRMMSLVARRGGIR